MVILVESNEETTLATSAPTSTTVVPTKVPDIDMMQKIAQDDQTLDDIKALTSSKVTDQLKVFLVAQARNSLAEVVKLTKFLDKLETKFMSKATELMDNDDLTLKQYGDVISVITGLLARSNEIISKVLRDDSLMTILNTTIYKSNDSVQTTSVVTNLRDAQSRERVRAVINKILISTEDYQGSLDNDVVTVEEENDNG